MIRPLARAAALLVAVPYLLLASALAPEHVHEPGADHDHDHPVAHSHLTPHAAEAPHTGAEFDHDDDHVVWLDSAILHQSAFQLAPLAAIAAASAGVVPAPRRWSIVEHDRSAPAHGPPKTNARFRGPPSLLA